MKRLILILIAACCLAPALAPALASAKQRYPVIGCWDLSQPGFNHYKWEYDPSGLCVLTVYTQSIDHVHWTHWGSRQAIGYGQYIDDLGFSYPAKITAYDLERNLFGIPGTSGYQKVHIQTKSELRVVERGPFNLFLWSSPGT